MSTNPNTTALAEATLILNLEIGKVSNRRKLDSQTDAIETDVDRTMLHLSVELFDAPELKACQRYLWNLKAQVLAKTVPSFLRGGMYMVKLEAVKEIDDLIAEAQDGFQPVVQAFADVID